MNAQVPLHHRIPDAWPDSEGPRAWRARLLGAILVATFVLGLLTAIPSVILAIREGHGSVLLIDAAALLGLGVLAFAPRIPYRWRAWGFLAIIFLLGVSLLVTVGAVSQIFLMAVPLLAVLLLGIRPAVAAIVLNAATMVGIGVLLSPDVGVDGLDQSRVFEWSVLALNLTFLSAVLTLALAALLSRLESALREHHRITEAVDAAGEGIIVGEAGGRILFANRTAQNLLDRLTEEETLPRVQDLGITGPEEESPEECIDQGLPFRGERSLGEDGEKGTLHVEMSLTPIAAPEESREPGAFVGILRDITAERAMATRLRRGERLEALGTLAGGVAHDFNNILGSVLALAQEAQDRETTPEVRENLETIVLACIRARDIVRQMMVFSRQHEVDREPLELAEVVEEALALVRASTPTRIQIHSHIESGGFVRANPGELHQVLLNLCANGTQAIPSGQQGSISVRIENQEDSVRLTVSDTGVGIPADHLPRIFDPFFTTKEVSQGTGLGLASVFGIVRAMEGEVQVNSQPGEGATFRIDLPRLDPGVDPVLEGMASRDDAPRTGLEILVVDDEVTLLRVTVRILEREGHQVTGVSDGIEALETFQADPRRFDLLVTDLTMPAMGGGELARRVRKLRQDLPIVLTSGFADIDREPGLGELHSTVFLPKPYTRDELLGAVDRLVDRP